MSIASWPAGESPRDKLLERGALALSDAELLASCWTRATAIEMP